MPFQKIQAEKLSDAVIKQIELLILRGILRPGDRLPAERDLADRLGVSRPSLRDALAELQSRGLLEARAGSGVYVSPIMGSDFSDTLIRLFSDHDEAVFDYIAFRRDLESIAAARAAQDGTKTDLQVIAAVFTKMEAAHREQDPEAEAHLDAAFHLAIVEASHNVVLLHMMRAMYQLLREGVFYNRQIMFQQRVTRSTVLEQHRAIHDAIQNRDPDAARKAVAHHMDYITSSLRGQRRAETLDAIARQRLDQEARR